MINSFFKNYGFLLLVSISISSALYILAQHFEITSFWLLLFNSIVWVAAFYLIYVKREREAKQIILSLKKIKEAVVKNDESDEIKSRDEELEKILQKLITEISGDFKYLTKLEKMRSEFLGNVSHELKTPIFAIQGFLETLINGAMDDESVNKIYLEKAAAHSEKLNQLVSDLIDISMIETGQMRMSFRYFELAGYLNEIQSEYLPLTEGKNLNFEVSKVNPKFSVFGDKNRLSQVFSNLITNSVKYTDSGKIQIEVEEFPDHAKISVIDTGIGISAEDLPRVFERFYRVDKARSRQMGGTGLGLSIVKHILERHQSKFEIISELQKGTRFSFTLRK